MTPPILCLWPWWTTSKASYPFPLWTTYSYKEIQLYQALGPAWHLVVMLHLIRVFLALRAFGELDT